MRPLRRVLDVLCRRRRRRRSTNRGCAQRRLGARRLGGVATAAELHEVGLAAPAPRAIGVELERSRVVVLNTVRLVASSASCAELFAPASVSGATPANERSASICISTVRLVASVRNAEKSSAAPTIAPLCNRQHSMRWAGTPSVSAASFLMAPPKRLPPLLLLLCCARSFFLGGLPTEGLRFESSLLLLRRRLKRSLYAEKRYECSSERCKTPVKTSSTTCCRMGEAEALSCFLTIFKMAR